MKLHFEDNLDYQKTAIEAAADLFCGQDTRLPEAGQERSFPGIR